MAMGTERSKPLHNFTLPCDLRWGNQRFLRCMKVDSGDQISPNLRAEGNSSGSSDHRIHNHRRQLPIQERRADRDQERDSGSHFRFAVGSPREGLAPPLLAEVPDGSRRFAYDDSDGGISATREKVMFDLQTAADKMKNAFFKDGGLEEGEVSDSLPLPPPPPRPAAEAAAPAKEVNHRPWNLRTRRAAGRTPPTGFARASGCGNSGASVRGFKVDAPSLNHGSSQMRSPAPTSAQKSGRHRCDGAEASAGGDKMERAKFFVALSKREIEEDFFSITGHRPPRRPRKRQRTVQKNLDTLFPGLWLTEVTPDMY